MKKLNENVRLGISQAVATLLGVLAISFTALPAYFENDRPDMSIIKMMMGDGRTPFSPLLMFGFILLILGVVCSLVLTVLHFMNKSTPLITTILAVTSLLLVLAGSIILACSILIVGLDKLNSELGFTQGVWGIRYGNILVPLFGLVAVGFTYPSALIILHQKDLEDEEKNKRKIKDAGGSI